MSFQQIDRSEQKIIKAYLDRVQALTAELPDVRIRVYDGEEVSFQGSFDRAGIEHVIGDTDQTHITVIIGASTLSNGPRHSTLFIHGNHEDVVSDSGWNEAGEWLEERLLKGVY